MRGPDFSPKVLDADDSNGSPKGVDVRSRGFSGIDEEIIGVAESCWWKQGYDIDSHGGQSITFVV